MSFVFGFLYRCFFFSTFINVHGPQGIQNILSATHSFMRFDNSRIKINVYEHDKSSKKKDHQDSEIIVHSFPIYGMNLF